MKLFTIYWPDLTPEKQQAMIKDGYQVNENYLFPIVIIEQEREDCLDCNQDFECEKCDLL